ncbi:hypothetical protein RhiirA1_393719 [Rhizophagus irregularis]|uniref:Uncharacterized protein n=1 Tax=Rhizophagus irregularis TaxID=588596 RepID=A0A2N0RVZ2_9GLOM|nr:hypothetical protein RhiirA1_393719 [Rhizophagus irregularis]
MMEEVQEIITELWEDKEDEETRGFNPCRTFDVILGRRERLFRFCCFRVFFFCRMVPCCRSTSWNESELVVTKLDFKDVYEDSSLNTKLDFKDSSLDTNQTLRTRRSTDFKAVGSSGSGLRTHGLNGGVSFFGDLSLFFQL